MNNIEIKPINIGIGGPLSALLTGFTGVNKNLPWWSVCPLYFVLASPLVLLCPILLPLWLLKVIADSKIDSKSYHEIAINEHLELLEHSQQRIDKLNEEKAATLKSIEHDKTESMGSVDVTLARVRKSLLDEQMAHEKLANKLKFHLVSVALAQFKISAFIKSNFITLLFSTLAYYGGLVLAFVMSSSLINDAMMRYMSLAAERKVLQIATQEQLDYANSVVNIIAWAGVFVLVMIISSFALVTIKALNYALKDNQVHGAYMRDSLLSLMIKTLVINLPGMGVLIAMIYACFINLERYYSHLRMIAMESMVLGQDYFDPTWLFLGLRLYIIYAFALALVSVILMSWHILPLNYKKQSHVISA